VKIILKNKLIPGNIHVECIRYFSRVPRENLLKPDAY